MLRSRLVPSSDGSKAPTSSADSKTQNATCGAQFVVAAGILVHQYAELTIRLWVICAGMRFLELSRAFLHCSNHRLMLQRYSGLSGKVPAI